MLGILIWGAIFIITEPKPVLRIYWSSLFLTVTGFLGWFFPWIAQLSGQSCLGYYLVDLTVLIYQKYKHPEQSFLFIVHHLMTLGIAWDTISYGELPWGYEHVSRMCVVNALMNVSSIFLAWKEMGKNPELYSDWHPRMGYDTSLALFGISFVIFRVLLGFPMIIYTLDSAPGITQLGLVLTLCFNTFWTSQIIAKVLKFKGL